MSYTTYYDRWMPTERDDIVLLARRRLQAFENHLPVDRNALIVDMGSGPGLLAMALADRGYSRVISFDADLGQVENGRRLGVDVRHVGVPETGDFIRRLGGQVGLFLLIDVLEHIPVAAQIETLKAIRESLSPGATLLCQVPNADSPVAMRYRYVDWTHHCSFTFESLQYVLSESGFDVASVDESPRHSMAGFGFGPRAFAWYALASAVRLATRLKMLPFVGREIAFGAPLSPNILAVAARPFGVSQEAVIEPSGPSEAR
jgi:SAM-dependent methyltransferase